MPLEEKSKDSKSSKDVGRNSKDDDGSDEDEERVDMSAITGMKDLEERREQFYQAQQCKPLINLNGIIAIRI